MKKILAILILVVAFAANADYLYWMVGAPDPASRPNFGGTPVTFTDWDYAKLVYTTSENPDAPAGEIATLTRTSADLYGDMGAYAYADIGSDYSGKTFLIELYSTERGYLGFATSADETISSYIFKMSGMDANIGTGWLATSFHVPEPTSGMLFLLGGMLLGLRRRRMA